MTTVDTRGMLCPAPLIHTKRAIKAASEGDVIEVILDNEVACCNVEVYLKDTGANAERSDEGDLLKLTFQVGSTASPVRVAANLADDTLPPCPMPTAEKRESDCVIVLNKRTMGHGEEELGEMLIRTYLNTLIEADRLPKAIVMYNEGVKLAISGSDTAKAIAALKEAGVEIVCCGVCLDYYEMKSDVPQEYIGNMFKIIQLTTEAGNTVNV